jgi:hypothetical protein
MVVNFMFWHMMQHIYRGSVLSFRSITKVTYGLVEHSTHLLDNIG